MRTDFFVAAIDTDAGERFVVLRPNDLPTNFFFPASIEEFRKWLVSSAVSRDQFVVALEAMGLQPDEIAHQLERARSSQNPVRGEFVWERTTEIGFRNAQWQVVVRKTDDYGSDPFQRLYELECTGCRYRYRRSGSDVHATCCPRCQCTE